MIANCKGCRQRGEIEGRGLCKPCYRRHGAAGTLDQYPTVRRPRIQIVGEQRQLLAKELVERYAEGSGIRSLASSTGCSYGFVHSVLTDAGVRLRGRGGARNARSTATRPQASSPSRSTRTSGER